MMTEIKTIRVKEEAIARELQAHYIEGWRIEAFTSHFSYQMYIFVLARDTATREEFEEHLKALNSDQVNDAYRREQGLPNGDGFASVTGEEYVEGYKAWAAKRTGLEPMLEAAADKALTPDWGQTDG